MAAVTHVILFLIRIIFTSLIDTTLALMVMFFWCHDCVIVIWVPCVIYFELLERVDNSRRFFFYFPIVNGFLFRLSLSHVRTIITYIFNGDN